MWGEDQAGAWPAVGQPSLLSRCQLTRGEVAAVLASPPSPGCSNDLHRPSGTADY